MALSVAGFLPTNVYAGQSCQQEGYSVVYINGIFTDRDAAENNRKSVEGVFRQKEKNRNLVGQTTFHLGYNATHVAGVGDVVKSILQKMWELEGETREDFDMLEIVRQIQPHIDTQKILILGHSQGTFYANALYDYLIRRGVSAKSLAVVNLATPASFVAGHGAYLTSTNDDLVKKVRAITEFTEHPDPLPANLSIPDDPLETGLFAGHSLSGVYLKERPTDIAAAIAQGLAKLESDPTRDPQQPCIPEARQTITHIVKRASFALLDTFSDAVATAGKTITKPFNGAQFASAGALLPIESTLPVNSAAPGTVVLDDVVEEADIVLPAVETQVFPIAPVQTENPVPAIAAIEIVPAVPVPPITIAPVPTPTPIERTRSFGGLLSLDPGFGASSSGNGTVPAVVATAIEQEVSDTEAISVAEAVAAVVVPVPVALSISAPLQHAFIASTSVRVSGMSDAQATVTVQWGVDIATTSVSDNGEWDVVLTLPEGEHEIVVNATLPDERSATSSVRFFVDITAPAAPEVAVQSCADSIGASSCVLTTQEVLLSIVLPPDATGSVIEVNGISTTTAAATYSFTASDKASTTVQVRAVDAAGNSSVATSTEFAVYTHPLHITEVAWMGTTAQVSDQWIEITNVSPHHIVLDGIQLDAVSGAFTFALSGVLAPYDAHSIADTYLIESRSGATTREHSLASVTLSMASAGDQLLLMRGSVVLDTTPAVATCGGWCAGALKTALRYSEAQGSQQGARTMERLPTAEDGALAAAWQTHDAYIRSSGDPKDAAGNFILGSPLEDAAATLPLMAWYCGAHPFSAGSNYRPESSSCTYLSGFMHTNANRYGALFRGTVGSSTEMQRHSLGKNMISTQSGDSISDPIPGEPFFVAIFEVRNGPAFANEVQNFASYFTGRSAQAPHTNYRVFEWVYQ